MRNDKEELYKKSTLIAYRHGIQRFLEKQRPRDNIDIVKGDDFKSSITAFKCMTKELKSKGKAAVAHNPFICDEDLVYRYLTDGNVEDPTLLQYKVFPDIMLHFGRRRRENLANLVRRDFAVKQDAEGTMYVYQCRDELTKNHQDDSERSSDGRMYEIKESIRCPVRSFVKYVRRLNPKCAKLFQNQDKNLKMAFIIVMSTLATTNLGV